MLSTLAVVFEGLIGLTLIAIGCAAWLFPEPMSEKFGIKVSGAALPYVRATGFRDIILGLVVFVLVFNQDWRSLQASIFCFGFIALADAWVVIKDGYKPIAFVHIAGAIAMFLFSAAALVLSPQ